MQVCVLSSGLNDHGSVPAMGTVLRFIATSIPRVCGLPSSFIKCIRLCHSLRKYFNGSDWNHFAQDRPQLWASVMPQ
jgi:hypothetical protein